MNDGLPHVNYPLVFVFAVIDTILLADYGGFLFRTTDYGSNWTSLNAGMGLDSNYVSSIFAFDNNVIVGTLGVLLSGQ